MEARFTLDGLPNTRGEISALSISTATEGRAALFRGEAITAAGCDGAINVWRDDRGDYRIVFCRFGVEADGATASSREEIAEYFLDWFQRIGDVNRAASDAT